MKADRPADVARAAYVRRAARRARVRREERDALRLERERLALSHALRRELNALAAGAGDLARGAQGGGRAAELAVARLAARRRRAGELLEQAERFSLDPGLVELEAQDRSALGV